MTRSREYRQRSDDFDQQPPYRGRPPSNRRPPQRYDDWEEERSVRYREPNRPPQQRGYDPHYDHPPQRSRDSRERQYQRPLPSNQRMARPEAPYGGENREWMPPPRQRPPRPVSGYGAQPLQQAKQSTNRKIFLFVYNLFFYTLTIGILLSSLMFAFSEKSDAAIMGHRFYQVLTDSMAPQPDSSSGGFYAGDIVLVKMIDGSQAKPGDIVTFQVGEGDRYLTHRMVERLDQLNGQAGDYIVTKGDANKSNDPPILAERVRGKVMFVVPKMGSFLNFIQENLWLCIVCVLSTFGFFLVLKAYFLQPEPAKRPMKRNGYPTGYNRS
ncbi:signal peptidase I [Candidatus Enterococcus ferrettii]|uniref:Signal peptidase I n=1 Tax=Candidatus Enterococcus ferrettii TaxID=2815324 RepID=A0ABV0EJM4_9ENTE|nr:signal peptidase I [Enterococcus sp. 665A]MBO1339041.1 signal peptidase I [Enterococcus sp. 665A]